TSSAVLSGVTVRYLGWSLRTVDACSHQHDARDSGPTLTSGPGRPMSAHLGPGDAAGGAEGSGRAIDLAGRDPVHVGHRSARRRQVQPREDPPACSSPARTDGAGRRLPTSGGAPRPPADEPSRTAGRLRSGTAGRGVPVDLAEEGAE